MTHLTIHAAAISGLLLLILGCSAPESTTSRPELTPLSPAVPPVASTRPQIAADNRATKAVFVDSLLPATNRVAGCGLVGLTLPGSGVTWSAGNHVTLSDHGATTVEPGGAHHAIPLIAGIIRVQADVQAVGSGFTGIALGHGDLSGNFWVTNDLLLFVRNGGYGLQAGDLNLISQSDAALLHTGSPDHLDLRVDTVGRTVSARINGTLVLDAVALPAATRVDGLIAAGFRFNEPVTTGQPRISGWQVEVTSTATAGLVPVDHAMCFVDPGRPATLRWTIATRGPTNQVPYVISDYLGKPVASGFATLADDGTASLTRTFARGWYGVAFPEAHQEFGIVALQNLMATQ